MDARRNKRLVFWIAAALGVIGFALAWPSKRSRDFGTRYDPAALINATEAQVRDRLGTPSRVVDDAWTYDEHDGSAVLFFEAARVKRMKINQH